MALAARAAAQKNKHDGDDVGKSGAGGRIMPAETYWEYESDSLVHASCEDNSDAEVYRVYPVKSTATRNVLYTLRFRPVVAEAVEVVRGMKLDDTTLSMFGSINQFGSINTPASPTSGTQTSTSTSPTGKL